MLNKNLNDKVKQRNTYRVPRKRSQALSSSSLSIKLTVREIFTVTGHKVQ